VGRGGALGLQGRVGNLLEAYRGGGLTGAACSRQGESLAGEGRRQAGVGVVGVDGWVGEQHTIEVELVGGSAGPGSGWGKLTPVGCSVEDRAGGRKVVGKSEELPRFPDRAPARRRGEGAHRWGFGDGHNGRCRHDARRSRGGV
jgi:hypothetical protein